MDARVYGLSRLNLSPESLSDAVTGPPPDAGQFVSEFPLLEDDSEGPLDIPSNIHNTQVNDEAGFLLAAGHVPRINKLTRVFSYTSPVSVHGSSLLSFKAWMYG